MTEHKLSREEIALSILNGIISSFSHEGLFGAIESLQEDNILSPHISKRACKLAFHLADLFIEERNHNPGHEDV